MKLPYIYREREMPTFKRQLIFLRQPPKLQNLDASVYLLLDVIASLIRWPCQLSS